MKGVEINTAGQPAKGLKIAIVASRFNAFVVDKLSAAAVAHIKQSGGDENDINLVKVPGAFEIPLAVQSMAESKKYDAVIAFGVVIKGETPHFDFISSACVHGLSDIALKYGVPVGMGVLTVNTVEQAEARAGDNAENKGIEAAAAAIEMAVLLRDKT